MKTPILISLLLISLLLFGQKSSLLNSNEDKDITERLEAFAELYGLVRYFHPSDEASSINWNKFAQYGVDLIQNTKTEKEFSKEIQDIFSLLAPAISFAGNDYQWEKKTFKPIFWKHVGLGHDSDSNRYKSSRINKHTKEKFYAVGTNVENMQLDETRIKLVYQAKSEGLAYAYLNVYDKNKDKLFFKNQVENPISSSTLENRELITPVLYNVVSMNLGMLTKRGESTLKNIQLFYEDTDKKWKEIPLAAFTDKAWYPVKKATLTKAKDSVHIGFEKEINQPYFNYKTAGATDISIPVIVYEEDDRTIPAADSIAFTDFKARLNNHETQHANTSCLSNIIISWNIFKHFYPYQDEVKVDWKNILNEGIENALNAKNKEDEWFALQRFTAVFEDGHIGVNPKDPYDLLIQNRLYNIPISFKYIGDKLVVDKVKEGTALVKSGDIVTQINDVETQIYMDSVRQYISGSPQYKRYMSLTKGFLGKFDTEMKIGLEAGATVFLKRTNHFYKDYSFYCRPVIQKDTIKTIEEDILYLNIDDLTEEQVTENYAKIQSSSKIILDLRGYPSKGNQVLLRSFFPSQKEFLPFHIPTIYEPNFQNVNWETTGWTYQEGKKLDAKIVLLVDERSISYAESTSSYLKHNDYVTIVGRPTAGANGNINKINLNNDFRLIFTGLKVTRPDGSQFHTLGVLPDVLVEETISSIREGRDVYIEEAIKVLNAKKRR